MALVGLALLTPTEIQLELPQTGLVDSGIQPQMAMFNDKLLMALVDLELQIPMEILRGSHRTDLVDHGLQVPTVMSPVVYPMDLVGHGATNWYLM